jgi:tRNA A-37 threonylcarbamoyl transferase component Bud32
MAPTETGVPPKDRPPPPAREVVAAALPQFEILELIGQGGMGCVFKARQPQLQRFVALKILPVALGRDPKFAARFTREAQALAALNHPQIVTIHDFGHAEGFFYLVMELVDGVSLRQLLREGRLPPETALAIVPKICEALQFAHERGVVHRDIKPENVLLDKQGRVKIADFGIAKMVGAAGPPERTGAGASVSEPAAACRGAEALTQDQVLGTPPYMAPEQVEHPQKVDHRADIYSLGVVFYEMLTGELPLGKFAPPSKKVQMDVRLDEVVLHALEKEPERRYQQVGQVKTDIETIAASPAGGRGRVSGPAGVSGGGAAGGPATERPWVAFCVAVTYAATVAFGGLWHLIRGGVPGGWLIAAFLFFGGASAGLAAFVNRVAEPAWRGRAFRVGAVLAFLAMWPLLGFAAFFLYALLMERGGWHPAPDEAVVVPLIWLAALVLPVCGWRLWQAARQPRGESGEGPGMSGVAGALRSAGGRGRRLAMPAGLVAGAVLLVLAMAGGFRLLMDQPSFWDSRRIVGADVVVRVEETLRREVLKRLAESGWNPEGLSVQVSRDLRRAECRFGKVWKNGLTQEPFSAGIGLAAQGDGLWLVSGEGEFHAIRFSVDTTGAVSPEGWTRVIDSTGAAPELAASAGRTEEWGSVATVILNDIDDYRGSDLLDLDTGKTLDLDRGFEQWARERQGQWLKDHGIDLTLDRVGERWGLITPTGNAVQLVAVTNALWESAGAEALNRELERPDRGVQTVSRPDVTVYVLGAGTAAPLTFAFETAQGRRGLLQITGFVEEPGSARLRVKVLGDSASDAPATSPGVREASVAQDGSGTHGSIQAALDAVNEGGVVRIGPGRYPERLLIAKSVSLVGAGWDQTVIGPTEVWTGPTAEEAQGMERSFRAAQTSAERDRLRAEAQARFFQPVVRVEGSGPVRFEGLKFTQPGIAPEGKLLDLTVVEVLAGGEMTLAACAVVGSPGNGLTLADGARVRVEHSLIAAGWNSGIRIARGSKARVVVADSDVRNCHYAGVVIGRGQSDVTIERCRVSGAAWHGIRYDDASPTIVGNLIFGNARSGIYASGRCAAEVRDNVFWRNEMNGMSCWFANRDGLTNNTFAGNRREGLSVLGASAPEIERNIFWQHPLAIHQGHIGDPSSQARASAPLRLRGNLFWTNAIHVASAIGQASGDTNPPPAISLASFPGNVEREPAFRDASGGDFRLLPEGGATVLGAGAPSALLPASPWPLQPEEAAMVPDGDTRDSRAWQRPRG